jgi:hypothetical protein
LQSNIKDVAVKVKDYERLTSKVQRRILNKVFYQFINWRSEAVSSFDVQRSMFDVQKTLYSAIQYFLIINILVLNLKTMPLGEEIKNIVLPLFDTFKFQHATQVKIPV